MSIALCILAMLAVGIRTVLIIIQQPQQSSPLIYFQRSRKVSNCVLGRNYALGLCLLLTAVTKMILFAGMVKS